MSVSFNDILDFWFKEAGAQKWYNGGDAFDAEIRSRFETQTIETAAELRKSGKHEWQIGPDAMLALIIMLDQFPRNMYRDTKGAFAFDDLALTNANTAIEQGYDLRTLQEWRAFYYMPLMHAENLDIQNECVRLIDMRLNNESSLFHAQQHRNLIEKFGRFPHRNKILGREDTDEEKIYLAGSGYRP